MRSEGRLGGSIEDEDAPARPSDRARRARDRSEGSPVTDASATSRLDALRADIEFTATLRDQQLRFRSTWGLFSPREVDSGSRLLLDFIEVGEAADCLDLGCGYGVIGLTLARLVPGGRTLLVDKDFVAVDYARRNADLNGLANVEVRLSNAFSHIGADEQFDLIASNIPARAGNEMLELMVADAAAHLRPGGRLYIVGLTGMRQFVRRLMERHLGDYEKLKQGRDYTVAVSQRT
ncbi:MAG: methyltransferase [Dehalococcoidia bacterium]|nr:methyltransferase [Dehalococcoidia bacterium]